MWSAPNTSGGFIDSLKAKWDELAPDAVYVLLVGEGRAVKDWMQDAYPGWVITTTDRYNPDADIVDDVCRFGSVPHGMFDLVINQANLEHVYDPFGAMRNLSFALKHGGVHVLHTHLPGMDYHAFPRDYFRFMVDWFEDLPRHLDGLIEVESVWTNSGVDVLVAFRRIA